MGNRAWIRGSCKLSIDQTENFFLFDLASLCMTQVP